MSFKKLLTLTFTLTCLLMTSFVTSNAYTSVQQELRGYLVDIGGAAGKVYKAVAKDGKNSYRMDCLKIAESPDKKGLFVGLFHNMIDSKTAHVYVATSENLVDWTYKNKLSWDRASQPTLRWYKHPTDKTKSGFMVAWEDEEKGSFPRVRLLWYESTDALLKAEHSKTMVFPLRFGPANGTPDIENCTDTDAVVTFHWFDVFENGDRQAWGKMKDWKWVESNKDVNRDNMVKYWYRLGNPFNLMMNRNIGDRSQFWFKGSRFELVEGGGNNSHFGEWRIFLQDFSENVSDYTNIKHHDFKKTLTDKYGNKAFANPTASLMTFKGKKIILFTMFVPSENKTGKHGCLIYWHNIK